MKKYPSPEELLKQMTLEERIAQMSMQSGMPRILENLESGKLPYGVAVYHADQPHTASIAELNRVQKYNIEETRLGIPMLVTGESIHGGMFPEATVFPQCIGLGASFNDALVGRIASFIGKECHQRGIRQTFAPDLDLSRDPRWGRVEENYGEDPYLTARMGYAYVTNLQKAGVAATPKHFIAHGSPEGGINLAPVHIGLREFFEVMYEPFYAAIHDAKALSVMPAYSEFDGIPCHTSHFLLTDILRGQMGFEGYTLSDFGALSMLRDLHHVASDRAEEGKAALYAGLDFEAPGADGFGAEFIEAAKRGDIDIEKIDTAVLRILRVKFALGLFEHPYIDEPGKIGTEEALETSYEAALESVVLLENDGTLPLKQPVSIALIGPNADTAQLGDYTDAEAAHRSVTVKAGFEARFGKENIHYARGCGIASGSQEEIGEAVSSVRQSDIAVLVLGDNSSFYGGVGWGDEKDGGSAVTCGEGFDSSTLRLPECQYRLFRAVKEAAGEKPVVLILECGRPYCIGDLAKGSNAVLYAWYPGERGGHAVAALIAGDVSPSAKLPISFPQTVGHLPCYYNYKPSARGFYKCPGSPEKPGRDYVFSSPDALYPFGHGLSYTTFAYSAPVVSVNGTDAEVTVNVTNTGDMEAKEAVLLFLRCHKSRITPFVKRLRGFEKITLAPGETKTVTFTLGEKDFSMINEQYQPEFVPGRYTVTVGSGSAEFVI